MHQIHENELTRQLQCKLAETRQELELYKSALRQKLALAAEVHRSLLPKPVRNDRILVDVRYVPIEEVGGDYCQVRFCDPEICYITICDVTGHGIGPALLATRVSSEVRRGILDGRPPREIVRSLNAFIRENFEESGLYLTFLAARIDLKRLQVTYAGAGHPDLLLVRRDGSAVEMLQSQNPMIGITDEILGHQPERTIDIAAGDRLAFYTDGLPETEGHDGRQLGINGLAKIVSEARSVGLSEVADYIFRRVAELQDGPATDDKTLIVAEVQ